MSGRAHAEHGHDSLVWSESGNVTRYIESFPDQPRTAMEFVMMPYAEQPSLDEAHLEAVARAVDAITDDRERQIIEAVYFEQIPFSELGKRLGYSKPHAWRLAQKAVAKFRKTLANDPVLIERYGLQSPRTEQDES